MPSMPGLPLMTNEDDDSAVLVDRMGEKETRAYHANNGMRLLLDGLSKQNLTQMRMGAVTMDEVVKGKYGSP